MLSIEELSFAQKYPFSSLSKKVVKENNFSLETVPDEILERAKKMISTAFEKKKYSPEIMRHQEIITTEILAFPVTKILLSLINNDRLTENFAEMFSNVVFQNLEREKDESLFDVAKELDVKAQLARNENFLAELSLMDFLLADNSRQEMKLVNLGIEKGKVLLNKNEFARFISLLAEKKLIESIPLEISGVPEKFKSLADELGRKRFAAKKRIFGAAIKGKINPDFFPPCYDQLYADLVAGKNLSHLARFDLASFLAAIGMAKETMVDLYRNLPNFNERITVYQIDRIIKSKYSPPGCAKLRTHKVCKANCNVKHPLQYYENQFKQGVSQAKAS